MIPNILRISCLCVVKELNVYIHGAIDSFLNQTYPNKELIILLVGVSESWERIVPGGQVVRCPDMSVGGALDLASEIATGELYCLWPPNSYSSPTRLARQARVFDTMHVSGVAINQGVWGPGNCYIESSRLMHYTLLTTRQHVSRYEHQFFSHQPLAKLKSDGDLRILNEGGMFGIMSKQPPPAAPFTETELARLPFDPWELMRHYALTIEQGTA